MLTITKSVKFDAAHVLTNHNGLCKNLHGHTYRVDVSVRQAANDSSDMVMDFKDVKSICDETVISKFEWNESSGVAVPFHRRESRQMDL